VGKVGSKRAENIVERCEIAARKVFKAVVADMGDYWKLIHVGKTTASKRYLRRIK